METDAQVLARLKFNVAMGSKLLPKPVMTTIPVREMAVALIAKQKMDLNVKLTSTVILYVPLSAGTG